MGKAFRSESARTKVAESEVRKCHMAEQCSSTPSGGLEAVEALESCAGLLVARGVSNLHAGETN